MTDAMRLINHEGNLRIIDHDVKSVFPTGHEQLLLNRSGDDIIHSLIHTWFHPSSFLTQGANLGHLKCSVITQSQPLEFPSLYASLTASSVSSKGTDLSGA